MDWFNDFRWSIRVPADVCCLPFQFISKFVAALFKQSNICTENHTVCHMLLKKFHNKLIPSTLSCFTTSADVVCFFNIFWVSNGSLPSTSSVYRQLLLRILVSVNIIAEQTVAVLQGLHLIQNNVVILMLVFQSLWHDLFCVFPFLNTFFVIGKKLLIFILYT